MGATTCDWRKGDTPGIKEEYWEDYRGESYCEWKKGDCAKCGFGRHCRKGGVPPPDYVEEENDEEWCQNCPVPSSLTDPTATTTHQACVALNDTHPDSVVDDCLYMCDRKDTITVCGDGNSCPNDDDEEEEPVFCNYEFGSRGTCQSCPKHRSECEAIPNLPPFLGRADCASKCTRGSSEAMAWSILGLVSFTILLLLLAVIQYCRERCRSKERRAASGDAHQYKTLELASSDFDDDDDDGDGNRKV